MKRIQLFFLASMLAATACQSDQDYDATGTFEATEIIVSAENNGKLFFLNAEEGRILKQGEEVGVIDTVQLHLK